MFRRQRSRGSARSKSHAFSFSSFFSGRTRCSAERAVSYRHGLGRRLFIESLESRQMLTTFVVNSVLDGAPAADGNLTLREALTAANTNAASGDAAAGSAAGDIINFAIAGAGPHVIAVDAAQGTFVISDDVTINGFSEVLGGASAANTNPITASINAVMKIVIDGQGGAFDGFRIVAAGNTSTIRGLVIQDFAGDGIEINLSNSVVIAGNFIGTDVTGEVDDGNDGAGVRVISGFNNRIGGTAAADRNLISGNDASGVVFTTNGGSGNSVLGNFIGTDKDGLQDLGNGGDGVNVDASDRITIGGTATQARNVIAGNASDGIDLESGADGHTIQGNYIGLGLDGSTALGNSDDGIDIEESSVDNVIGGATSGARNVISSNGSDGIVFSDLADDNTVQGNFIGTASNGTTDRGNGGHGIAIFDSDGTLIGGAAAGEGNTIAFNDLDGVRVIDAGATGNRIQRNTIRNNKLLGIDLNGDGATVNDNDDPDAGANLLQNFPVILGSPTLLGDSIQVRYRVDSDPANSAYPIVVEFFIADSDDQEGRTFLAEDTWTAADFTAGEKVFLIPLAVPLTNNTIVATATDDDGNTSEFSGPADIELPFILGSQETIILRDRTIGDDETDLYQYIAHSTGKMVVRIDFLHVMGDLALAVLDEFGNELASSDTSSPDQNFEQVIIPVVGQELYFIRVTAGDVADDEDGQTYSLEVENFPAPVPSGLHLDPASDTGWYNNDNVTFDNTPRIFIQTDVLNFVDTNRNLTYEEPDAAPNPAVPDDEIDALTGDEADLIEAGAPEADDESGGIAVEVTFYNTTDGTIVRGFATVMPILPPDGDPDSDDYSDVYEFTVPDAQALTPGVYMVAARTKIFDGQGDEDGEPDQAEGRSNASPPLLLTIEIGPTAIGTFDLLASSDTGMFDNDNVTNKDQPAFGGVGPANHKVHVFAQPLSFVGTQVTGGTLSTTQFTAAGLIGSGLVAGDRVQFTSPGANLNQTRTIQTFNNATGAVVLTAALPAAPVVGDQIAILGVPLLVGEGVVGSDFTDGILGNEQGAWEVTVEPLDDGKYNFFAQFEDAAGLLSDAIGTSLVLSGENLTDVAIPDLTTVTSTIAIATTSPQVVVDVNVTINIDHDFSSDLEIFLISPSGTEILLSGNNGFGADFTDTVFDDSAALSIEDNASPFTGRFRPEEPLSIPIEGLATLIGEFAAGTWTLRIVDNVPTDAGTLLDWSIDIQTALQAVVDTTEPNTPYLDLQSQPASTIVVTTPTTITDLNVTITSLTHLDVGQLDIFLVGPNGTRVELSTDNGGAGNNFTNTVFDDEAGTSITAGSAPFTGSFRPEGLLSAFDGQSALGTYYLEIVDDTAPVSGQLVSWSLTINGGAPIASTTPALDLDLIRSDTGRSDVDDITRDNTPTVTLTSTDPNVALAQLLFTDNLKFRVFDRYENLAEFLLYDSSIDALADAQLTANDTFTALTLLTKILPAQFFLDPPPNTNAAVLNVGGVGVLADGVHNLKLEVEDRAGNISHDFLLTIIVDTATPPVSFGLPDGASTTDGLHPESDSGVASAPATAADRITNDTTPKLWGRAEANTIIRVYYDRTDGVGTVGVIDLATDIFLGQTVALPYDGNDAYPDGYWELTSVRDLNEIPGVTLDGVRQLLVTAEDVAGNPAPVDGTITEGVDALEIFIDTQGPQITDIIVPGFPDFDLFQTKPTDGPTPLVHSLQITLQDPPERDPDFLFEAIVEALATPGNFSVIGDHVGPIPIESVTVELDPVGQGDFATATITLNFVKPLLDDRYTITIGENIVDPAGNDLDGEPDDDDLFDSGNSIPGGVFTARFTVDSRPEIGSSIAQGIQIDINGNYVWDPANGQIGNDHVNVDLAFELPGFENGDLIPGGQSPNDLVFVGKFVDEDNNGGGGNGNGGGEGAVLPSDLFDQLASYGNYNGVWRWLIDLDSDGVVYRNGDPDLFDDILTTQVITGITGFSSTAFQAAIPIAGNFDRDEDNGDEIGLYYSGSWAFDTNRNFVIDNGDDFATGNLLGHPIVGDFDGDGDEDLAVFNNNVFSFDLTFNALTDSVANSNHSMIWGFPGTLDRPVAADMNRDGVDDIGLWVPRNGPNPPTIIAEWYFLVSDTLTGFVSIDNATSTAFTSSKLVGADIVAGELVRFLSGQNEGLIVEVDSFNAATGRITLEDALNAPPEVGDTFSVGGFVNDIDELLNHGFNPVPFGLDLFAEFGDELALPIVGNFDPPVDSISQPPQANNLPGDFNNDDMVDGTDFLNWQRNPGGTMDSGDLADWEDNFGAAVAAATSSSVAGSEMTVEWAAAGAESEFAEPQSSEATAPVGREARSTGFVSLEQASRTRSQGETSTRAALKHELRDAALSDWRRRAFEHRGETPRVSLRSADVDIPERQKESRGKRELQRELCEQVFAEL